jgi:hypothetical protein
MARFSLSGEETAMTSDASEAQALADAADAAGKGPSIQHTQPWRWCLTGDELDLYVDYRHGLEVTDVEARLAVLSCGTALHRAVVKLTADGWHAVLARLPNRAHPDFLAQVRIAHQTPAETAALHHYQTIARRHTNRRPNVGTGLDGEALRSITAAVQSTGTRLRLLRPAQATDSAAVAAVLYGSEDSTLAWLRAGEALSAAWLTATELAVSVVPMSATIESATGREKLRRLLGGVGYPYLVLCLARHIGLEDAHARCPCMPGWS